MADEDEEDYMSDKFLLSTTDNNPGLVPDKIAKKYRREMKHKELNQRNKMKPMREREMEHREQGLANALDSSNKGFAMLQKMGFKKGMGLGKEGTLKSSCRNIVPMCKAYSFRDTKFAAKVKV